MLERGLEFNLGDGERKYNVLEKLWIWRLKDICDVFVLLGIYCETLV